MNGHDKLLLLGCGILKKEVQSLIEKNHWPVDTLFFGSALHCDFNKLSHTLTGGLQRHADRQTVVFYGACHPLMHRILADAHTIRTEGQNCVEMILGRELFDRELEAGAFFLFEDWALHWDHITQLTFGTDNWNVIREMFHSDRKYFLALRTPCSGDFRQQAEAVSARMHLPLHWMDVSLAHLERVMREALQRKGVIP